MLNLVSKVSIAASGAALAAAVSASSARPSTQPHRSGETLYAALGCAQCHGYAGQGGNAGPRLAGKPYPLEAFVEQLRHPADEMPPYTAKVLDDAQAAALHAHVTSLR